MGTFILSYSQETEGPYCTELPTPDDIRRHLELEHVVVIFFVVAEEQYNLAYFFVKRIQCARDTPTANLPYGMFLTCPYRHVMETYPHLDNGIYNIVERVMRTLFSKKPKSDDLEVIVASALIRLLFCLSSSSTSSHHMDD
ncbi:hypothetical protein Tco_0492336 [Tanacetum coccineum]